ncbi:hypothetical protein M8J75_004319 [Diaphorina citri]|nr:hypothetical protein M8J75_004319 [Diaphorina citri]
METLFLNEHSSKLKSVLELALQTNESSASTWIGYKKDLESVKTNLKSYSEKFDIPIMIPLCSKAMIPGILVHTNQVLVGLGDSWFTRVSTKSAVENCERKIQFCSEMIHKYEKEKEILVSRQNFPAFDEGEEIIETLNEEKMNNWMKKNKQENQIKATVAEEELWRRLDELELQEELEDELLLLNEEKEEDDLYDEEEEQNDSGHSSEEEEEIDVRVNSNRTVISDIEPLVQHVPISTSSSHEDNVIRIRHSDLTLGPVSYCTESPYQTPACIYREYLNKKNDAMGER